jgi:hypothetical protein
MRTDGYEEYGCEQCKNMLRLVKASDGIANLKDITEELESVTFSPGQDALQTMFKSDKARVIVVFHIF